MMWPDSGTTQELLRRAEKGDPAAVNDLFERHREAIRRLLALRMDRRLATRVDASDIVQDVLVEAHRRLGEYLKNAAMPFHLWLRALARDRLIDAHRRHRLAARRSLDREQHLGAAAYWDRSSLDLAAALRDSELTPAAAALRRELETRFRAALEQLDDTDREVIVMRHVERLTNREVAQALELSDAAAGMRYLRAIRRLRGILGEAPSGSHGR
jgi:RNA polymerase sigma-70 factor (ECF subfamily)